MKDLIGCTERGKDLEKVVSARKRSVNVSIDMLVGHLRRNNQTNFVSGSLNPTSWNERERFLVDRRLSIT